MLREIREITRKFGFPDPENLWSNFIKIVIFLKQPFLMKLWSFSLPGNE
jgi:hypothetical protein